MNQGMHLTPLGGGVVLLEPNEGLDPSDPDAYLVPLVEFLQGHLARRLIYDLKKVVIIDDVYYGWLERVSILCRVVGIEMVVVNMRPAAAFTLSQQLQEPPSFTCALDVDRARG